MTFVSLSNVVISEIHKTNIAIIALHGIQRKIKLSLLTSSNVAEKFIFAYHDNRWENHLVSFASDREY